MIPLISVLRSRRMLLTLLLGFSSGLPLLTTLDMLKAWMKDAGIDLTLIGLSTIVSLPYTLKFIWAPFFDKYVPPFLGRRRGWMLIGAMSYWARNLVWALQSLWLGIDSAC